ncbi:MAG: exonuclease SbcCD subunit D [Chloroflexi bacterium]|nr:exonuclease SbcCD subunit D [Chloroflexota bacterium]
MKLLHFADAHIDMANYGRHDPLSGMPLRVLDFLKSLDAIVDAAVDEKVDLVIFAGDAYKDRSPGPTFQREWGRRIMRLSKAGIRTLLLVGNHDLSPALGRAHAIQEFETLEIPYVTVLAKPACILADELGLPAQVLALPWVSRSGLMAALGISAAEPEQLLASIENRLTDLVQGWLAKVDPSLPVILAAHASIEGALYGSERTVMLGSDLILPASLVRDPRLDYVALGHIHKPQDLNRNAHPPVIYPGSIERVDFGEASDDKYFIVADVEKGNAAVQWRELSGIRPFLDYAVRLESSENITETLKASLPEQKDIEGAIVRLTIDYPREWEPLLDEGALRDYARAAFEFHLVKRPQLESRIRLSADQTASSLSPLVLLEQYWLATKTDADEIESLQKLAASILVDEEEMENEAGD